MTTYNTGNPIGSTEVKDLYDNAQNFDTLANTTTLETVPDRLGVPRMSLHGFEEEAKRRFESIKFQPPIPYAPGIEVTTSSLTVDYLGVLYYALPSALPFTTGAWNPAQWSPVQNTNPGNELLVFDDYAAASAAAATLPDGQAIEIESDATRQDRSTRYVVQGGALIYKSLATDAESTSFIQGGTGAISRTVQDKLRDIVSVKDSGAVGDGVADDTAAFQSVYNDVAAGATMRCTVPPGTYRLATSPVIGAGCVIWEFDPGAVISGPGTLPYTSPPINKGKRVNTGQPIAPFQGGIQRFDSPLVMGDTAHAFFSSGYLGPITKPEDAVLFGAYAVDSVDHPRTWTQNINIVKQTSGSLIEDNYACGIEISVQNQTNVVGAPNADECLMGLFASYIKSAAGSDKASAAVVVAGDGATSTQGWQSGVWIDNIVSNGVGIRIGNINGGQAMGAALDTRDHAGPFQVAAILLGNNHRILSNNPAGVARNLIHLDGSDYLQIGGTGISGGTVINTPGLLLPNIPTQTTATAGAATLPSNPVGFITVTIGGTNRKIPFYGV